MHRTEHFELHELVPPDVYHERGDAAWELLDTLALMQLDAIRDIFGPVYVNDWFWGGEYTESGYRRANTQTGAEFSQHKFGRGFDCKFRRDGSITPQAVYQYILANPEQFPYITTLEDIEHTPTWLHWDRRNNGPDTEGIRIIKP